MKLEKINNKSIMNIGLINVNYNEDIQLEQIKPLADTLIYFDNYDFPNILEYIRDNDTLLVLTYSFIHDDPLQSLNFKSELDLRNIKIYSIMERTLDKDNATNDLMFNLSINMYKISMFIMQHRINRC